MPVRPGTFRLPRLSGRHDASTPRALPTCSRQWRAIRARILVRDLFTCKKCGGYGNEADHVDGNDADHRDDNLQTLCRSCHSEKTATENGGFGNRKRNNG